MTQARSETRRHLTGARETLSGPQWELAVAATQLAGSAQRGDQLGVREHLATEALQSLAWSLPVRITVRVGAIPAIEYSVHTHFVCA